MRVLLRAQDVVELVNEGYTPVGENAIEAQRAAQRETRKKDQKALFYIHQCFDLKVFEKISEATTAKEAWDILVRCYGGDATVKKVKLQSLRKQYEILEMKKDERVANYISRVVTVTNEMKINGETVTEQMIVEKVLRSLTPKFDIIMVAIQQSKDTSTMKIDELQGTLEVHEVLVIDRGNAHENQQALKSQIQKSSNVNKSNWKEKNWKSKKQQWLEKEREWWCER